MTDNSFFEAWDGPFGLPTFDRIRPEHFPSAFDRVMAEHNAEIAAITGSAATPSFANTIEGARARWPTARPGQPGVLQSRIERNQ